MTPPEPPPESHRTVDRVVAILELVASAEPQGVRLGDLVRRVGAPKSSVHGLTRGLFASGYLRESNGAYRTGPALGNLAGLVGASVGHEAYADALEELRDYGDETALIAGRVGDDLMYLAAFESSQDVHYVPRLRERRRLWPASSGKVLLGYLTPEERERHLRQSIADPEGIADAEREIQRIRTAGICLNRGETRPGTVGAAAPILIAPDRVGHVLAFAGPAERLLPHLDDVAAKLQEVARRHSAGTR